MADQQTSSPNNQRTDASTADLMRQLSEQTSRLVSQEIELAKAEVSEKGKKAGIGAGMFGGAGLFGLYALGALIATAIAALSLAMDTWLGALIVTVVLGAIAGILALQGRNKIQQAMPPAPQNTIETVREDVETTKQAAQRGRSGA
jgi:predicted phage tail protein